jgi:hypothetical protein
MLQQRSVGSEANRLLQTGLEKKFWTAQYVSTGDVFVVLRGLSYSYHKNFSAIIFITASFHF